MYIDERLLKILETHRGETVDVNFMISLIKTIAKEHETEQLRIGGVSGSADADYWSERCKHAENIWEKSPCDPDITEEQIEAHNKYHNFIKENGSKHYR